MERMNERRGYLDYKELLDDFVERTRRALGTNLVSIALYGSVARGTTQRESDIDLLLVVREASVVYYERLAPIVDILLLMRRLPVWLHLQGTGEAPYLSVLILSEQEACENRYIFLDLVAEAIMLHDEGGFLKARLAALAERLQELGARKVRANGDWYWDLKPDLQPGEALTL